MAIPVIPRLKTKHFQPGLEIEHEVGLSGVGVCVIESTLALNTETTAAEVVDYTTGGLNAVNVSTAAFGSFIHSLGAPPTAVIPMVAGTFRIGPVDGSTAPDAGAMVSFQYITATNTAVYIWGFQDTGAVDTVTVLKGVAVRIVCIR